MNRRQLVYGGAALALAGAGAAALGFSSAGLMADYEEAVAAMRARLAEDPQPAELLRYATLAASSHNTQAWRFRPGAGRITILPDAARRTPVVDPDDHHLFASLGCAAENLSLAAAAAGRGGALSFDPAGEGAVVCELAAGLAERSDLFEAIPRRQSTRADYDGRAVAAADLAALAEAARLPGVDLVLLTERPRIERVTELVLAGNGAQIADPAFMRELRDWVRFSPREALETGDGLFTAASGNPTLPAALGRLLFGLLLRAGPENDRYARQLRSSAGVAVFVAAGEGPRHWVAAGRAAQRFALKATALGLRTAFVNQPVEVAPLRPALADLVGMRGRRPDLVMRFGYGPALPFSARRPAAAALALA